MAMEEEAVEEEGVMGMAEDMVGVIIYFAIPEVCCHLWSEGTLVKRLPTESESGSSGWTTDQLGSPDSDTHNFWR